jgi:hypothetical protein
MTQTFEILLFDLKFKLIRPKEQTFFIVKEYVDYLLLLSIKFALKKIEYKLTPHRKINFFHQNQLFKEPI